jgi:Mg/Co/Ni transporter MgtE
VTRLRAILNDLAAFVRGEPVLSAWLGLVVAAVAFELRPGGDGLQWAEVGGIVVTSLAAAITRANVTPTANPLIRALPTDPPSPADPKPVITLSGRR